MTRSLAVFLAVLFGGAMGTAWAGPAVEDVLREVSSPAFVGLVKGSGERHLTTWTDDWTSLGVWAHTGDLVSVVAEGSWDAMPGLAPRVWVWVRVGSTGEAFNLRRDAQTFVAQSAGDVEVLLRGTFLELREDPTGETRDPTPGGPGSHVDARALGVVWKGQDLDRLLREDAVREAEWAGPLLGTAGASDVPDGFEHLHFLSDSEAFSRWRDDDGHVGVRVRPNRDYGIIRKPLDLPLTPDTRIEFDWRYVALPAAGPETEVPNHDYTSIAVEFDNGQDITWLWSRGLKPGTIFPCPLAWWSERETHIVLQSGEVGLGDWHHHVRNLVEDYEAGVEGALPRRITGLWFIANNGFQGRPAESYFANVTIHGPGGDVRIFE